MNLREGLTIVVGYDGSDAARRALVRVRDLEPRAARVLLVEVAREVAADLLVVGRRGGDFVVRTLLGSVAQRVVQQAPCDVLVVA